MNDLIYRLQKRAEIRRQITTRKSVQENAPDRISDLLEEAAAEIEFYMNENKSIRELLYTAIGRRTISKILS